MIDHDKPQVSHGKAGYSMTINGYASPKVSSGVFHMTSFLRLRFTESKQRIGVYWERGSSLTVRAPSRPPQDGEIKMGRDISDKVNEIVGANPEIQQQYDEVLKHARIFLSMVNDKLHEENDNLDVYTITIGSKELHSLTTTRH